MDKSLVREPLRRNQQDVHLVSLHALLDLEPVVLIVGMDSGCTNAHAFRRSDLISHQRYQRAYEQGRPHAGFAQHFSRNEVDEALAPSCPLHDEQTARTAYNAFNSFELPSSELGVGATDSFPEKRQCAIAIEMEIHGKDALASGPLPSAHSR